MKVPMRTVTGRIILVQEDRFRMVDDRGAGYLFTLSRKTRTSAEDLIRLHRDNVKVVVDYDGESDLDTGIAHDIIPF